MQFNQPYFVAGPPNSMQFYPCITPSQCPQNNQVCPNWNSQSYSPFHAVVGEGDVTSVVLPDGTAQWFFIPAGPPQSNGRCAQSSPYNACRNNTSWNNVENGAWFVRSVNHPALRKACQQIVLQSYGDPRRNPNYCSCSDVIFPQSLPPCPQYELKFHNDRCTSTEDLAYFCQQPPPPCLTISEPATRPCDAQMECQTPHNSAVQTPTIEVFVERCGPDTPDETLSSERCDTDTRNKTCRGKNRKKRSAYECSTDSSICSSCARNRNRKRRRRNDNDSDYDSECSLCLREEQKRKKKANENFKRENEKKRKQKRREKGRKASKCSCIIDSKQMDCSHMNKNNNDITTLNRQHCIRQTGESIISPQQPCIRESGKLIVSPPTNMCTNVRGTDPVQESRSCLVCKMGAAVGSAISYLSSSSTKTTTPGYASTNKCTKPSNKGLQNQCIRKCPSKNSKIPEIKMSEKELQKKHKAEQKQSEKEFKIREVERKKAEKEFQKKLKAEQKKSEKELKIREVEREKSEKEFQKKLKAEQKQSENELKIREVERKKPEKEFQKKLKTEQKQSEKELKIREAERIKSEKEFQKKLKAEQKQSEKELKIREAERKKLLQKKLKAEQKKSDKELNQIEKELRNKESKYRKRNKATNDFEELENMAFDSPCSSKQCGSTNDLSFSDSCFSVAMSNVDSVLKETKKERLLKIVDILEDPCRDSDRQDSRSRCGNYCKIAKTFENYLSQRNNEKNTKRNCGVSCEVPISVNKQMATYTDESNSGIFADIIKNRQGIGIQCSSYPQNSPSEPLCGGMCPRSSVDSLDFPMLQSSVPCNPL